MITKASTSLTERIQTTAEGLSLKQIRSAPHANLVEREGDEWVPVSLKSLAGTAGRQLKAFVGVPLTKAEPAVINDAPGGFYIGKDIRSVKGPFTLDAAVPETARAGIFMPTSAQMKQIYAGDIKAADAKGEKFGPMPADPMVVEADMTKKGMLGSTDKVELDTKKNELYEVRQIVAPNAQPAARDLGPEPMF